MDFARYLAAKKDLDSRSLNHQVWTALVAALRPDIPNQPLRALELGAGTGTMIERLLERQLFAHAEYLAIDRQPENLDEARERLRSWAAIQGREFRTRGDEVEITWANNRVNVHLVAADIAAFAEQPAPERTYDLLLANACLDELDLPRVLPPLLARLAPGGLAYFTINFDGATILEPTIDPAFDDLVETVYHRTMDERRVAGRPSGGSRTGRALFGQLRAAGLTVLAAGSSDWTVFAGADGYAGDEAYLLRFILDIMERVLRDRPEIDPARLTPWLAERRAQVERGDLVYIAHQIDILGRAPGPGGA